MDIFGRLGRWLRGVFGMIGSSDIKRQLGITVSVSEAMAEAQQLWHDMYVGEPPWKDKTTQTMRLPASIAREIARLITIEMQVDVSGSARADWLGEQLQPLLHTLRMRTEIAVAHGGMAFKPYIKGNRIIVDCIRADAFFPVSYDDEGSITEAVFVDRKTIGQQYYTRLEHHKLDGTSYTIRNRAFRSYNKTALETEIPLSSVADWADLQIETIVENVDKPLFAYFRPALANNIDPSSPLGISVYAEAWELIRDADRQYSRYLWEYEGGELAIDASTDLFDAKIKRVYKSDGTYTDEVHHRLPKGHERLYRLVGASATDSGQAMGMKAWTPVLRDESYKNGLNAILQRIEFACGLAFGTLSDPQSVDKTATEIRASKQRSYAMIADMQAALETALKHLLYCMDVFATAAGLAPAGTYDAAFAWDDSIVVDTDVEFARRMQLVQAGICKPESLYAWYFGCTEEQALEQMPKSTQLFGDEEQMSFAPQSAQAAKEQAKDVSGKTLNGAQTQSLMSVLTQYQAGQLTFGQAVNIISTAIGVTKEEARKIIEGTE